ncbi:unnamed protein product [Caenorhabditis nigoni]
MMIEEMKLQLIYRAYYPISITLSLISNILLLFIMKTTRSALLKDMQYYLLNTAICEILVSASTFLAQCRPVANKTTLAVFCYGPCKHFGPNTCFFMFALVQASVVAASFSILLSFYYRYRLLQVHVKNARSHKKTIAIFSLLPTSMLIFQLFTESDFAVVEAETRLLHQDYDYTNNSLIGFSNTKGVGGTISQISISLGVYSAPFIAFYYKRKINKVITSNTSNQRIPVAYCKQLINGLLLQTMVPFVVYIPPFTYVLVSQFTGHSSLYAEYLLNTLGSFTAFINPLLTFYYVLPYRRALCKRVFKYFPSVSEEGTDITTYPAAANFHRRNTATTKV